MSSSYGRPSPRQVSISAGNQRSNTPAVKLPSGSNVTANAPYRDNRSPAQAAKNVEIKNQAINSLIEFATGEQVQQFAIDQFDNAAKREAGAALDAYPSLLTTGGGNQEAIDAYNALSPRAKDNIIEARTINALSSYGPALQGAYASEPVLFESGNTPQQQELRAAATARAQAKARDISGVSALPSYQVAQNVQRLAELDGAIKGQAYKIRMSKGADLAVVETMDGVATVLRDSWSALSAAGASDAAGDQPLTTGLRGSFEQIATGLAQNFGPEGQAKALAGGIVKFQNDFTDAYEQVEFFQRLQKVIQEGPPILAADGKTNLWDVPIDEQGSIRQWLAKALPAWEERADKHVIGHAYKEYLKLESEGRAEEARALMLQYVDMLNDPSMIPQFIRQMDSLAERISPEEKRQMQINDYKMFERHLDGEDPKALYKEMIVAPEGTYSRQAAMRMYGIAENGGENVEFKAKRQEYKQIKSATQDLFDVNLAEYAEETGEDPSTFFTLVPGSTKREESLVFKKIRDQFESEVREIYFEKKASTDPKNWDPEKAMKDSYKEAVVGQREKAPKVKPVTYKSRFNGYTKEAGASLTLIARNNGNRVDPSGIPASAINSQVFAQWQAANPDKQFSSLTGQQKERLVVKSFQALKRWDKTKNEYRYFTEEEARKEYKALVKNAEQRAAAGPQLKSSAAPVSQQVAQVVPETEAEVQKVRQPGGGNQVVSKTLELLEQASQWAVTPQKDPFNFNKIFNNGGFGPQAMSYVESFLNLAVGGAPANAGEMENATPESLQALRQSWKSGQQGLNTPPMPQVAAATPVRYAPIAITNDKHELFVMIGIAEGTRTASGGYTQAYYGHRDPGDGHYNRGTVSGGRGSNMSPEMVDRKWMGTLTAVQQRMRPVLMQYGLKPGTQGFNRMMFNLLDLTVQAPVAAQDLAGKLAEIKAKGWTVEAIAKARADSFINPRTGRLEAGGFGNSYQRLMQDQRSRAGVYDYRRRI